jgi:hypothetical protein
MQRTCALVVVAALISSNCAARGPAAARQTGSRLSQAQASSTVWRQYASGLPIGSRVRVRTTDGERLNAVLMAVDDTGITVKPRTRIPEPARPLPFDRLAELELAREDSNIAKAAIVGGGVGAGVFLGLMMLLFAGLD